MTQPKEQTPDQNSDHDRSPGTKARTDLGPLGNAVSDRVGHLLNGYINDDSQAVAALAKLRSGAGRPFGACPGLWGLAVDPADYEALWDRTRRRPRRERSESAERAAEEAVHGALTLFALHQQSLRGPDQRMHVRSRGGQGRTILRRARYNLGWAVRGIMPQGEIDPHLHNRLRKAAEACSHTKRVGELRHIVSRLRQAREPLDYGLLAEHLYAAQHPQGVEAVKDAWGHGFVTRQKKQDTTVPPAEPETDGSDGTGSGTDSGDF